MRTPLQWILPVFLVLLSACTDPVQEELNETHARLAALQEAVSTANAELTALHAIMAEMDDSHTVSQYFETSDGYDLHFNDGKVIHIHFGVDGKDGRVIPIGVRMDEDSLYYWTLDGEWLPGPDSLKVPAAATDGTDGLIPRFEIDTDENGEDWWYMVFVDAEGNEISREKLASCDEMDGYSVFRDSLDLSDPEWVVLYQRDWTPLPLPRYVEVFLAFSEAVREVALCPGETARLDYKVEGTRAVDSLLVVTTGTDGIYSASLTGSSSSAEGKVLVTAPDPFVPGYILVMAYADGYSAIQQISFRAREMEAPEGYDFQVDSAGGTLVIPFKTDFEYEWTFDGPEAWEVVPGDGVITVTVTANPSPSTLSGTIRINPAGNRNFTCATFTVRQESAF